MLLAKLKYYGLSFEALKWFFNYLVGREQTVKTAKQNLVLLSNTVSAVAGVPQGSILGPLLFIIYTVDFPSCLENCSYHSFADDTQIYHKFPISNALQAIGVINAELQAVFNWSTKNGLLLNPHKTQAMLIGNKKRVGRVDNLFTASIELDGTLVSFTSECKSLGLTIDQCLNFTAHVNSRIKTAYAKLRSIYRYKYLLPAAVKWRLVDALILSLFDYCDVVYDP